MAITIVAIADMAVLAQSLWRRKTMPLNLIYITNRPEVALIAESNGVQRIMVDMETLGKEDRQKNMNTVKSHHTVADVAEIAKVLTKSELLVRINPWHEDSKDEIEAVIAAGADSIMLPMWKSEAEVDAFLRTVNKRVLHPWYEGGGFCFYIEKMY